MVAHYNGFNFSPNARVVRCSKNGRYGSKRSSGPNALSGLPYQSGGIDHGFAISFSSEQDEFKLLEFYVTIFNISNPTVVPTRSAELTIWYALADSYAGYMSGYLSVVVTIPVGQEMYRLNLRSFGISNIYVCRISAIFSDSVTLSGVIIDNLQIERLHYPKLTEKCLRSLQTLTVYFIFVYVRKLLLIISTV